MTFLTVSHSAYAISTIKVLDVGRGNSGDFCTYANSTSKGSRFAKTWFAFVMEYKEIGGPTDGPIPRAQLVLYYTFIIHIGGRSFLKVDCFYTSY